MIMDVPGTRVFDGRLRAFSLGGRQIIQEVNRTGHMGHNYMDKVLNSTY
jgi:hypothetical protein